jgi:hypothetical protein
VVSRPSWKIMLTPMLSNVIVSEADALNVCHTKRGRKTRALWEISLYQRMFDAISEVLYGLRLL